MPTLLEVAEPFRYLALFSATGLIMLMTGLSLGLASLKSSRCKETPESVARRVRRNRIWRLSSRLDWLSFPAFAVLSLFLGVRLNSADATLWSTIEYCIVTFGPCTLWLFSKELLEAWLLREPAITSVSTHGAILSVVRERFRVGSFSAWTQLLLPVCLIQVLVAQYRVLADLAGPAGSVVVSFVAVITLLSYLPTFAGWWMGTTEVEPDMKRRISYLFSQCNVRLGAVRLVPGAHWSSAAVVGVLPWGRQLWVGEALVRELSAEEFDMVVLHELAHIRKHHFLFRMMPTAWACLAVWSVNLGFECLPATMAWSATAAVANLIVAIGVFGAGMLLVSHASELEADRHANELAISECEWAAAESSLPMHRLASALRKVIGRAESASRRSWLYPSLEDRIRNLAAAQVNARIAPE
ncbi:MAG: M48 family metalloprotease [Pirellulaceae bacterium]